MEKFIAKKHKDETLSITLVSNGCTEIRGRIADKRITGGWKSSPFIIANEVAEKLAFITIAVNIVSYFVAEMHQALPTAIIYVNAWSGIGNVCTVVGAFLADSYMGRFITTIISCFIYALGMMALTLSASIDSLHPPPCNTEPCTKATIGQITFLCGGLALMAIGTGGMKPCVSSFGADQYDDADEKEVKEKSVFFGWFYFATNMGALFSVTVMVYIKEKMGWDWCFGLPTGVFIFSILLLIIGLPYYRFQKPMGSPFTGFFQVVVASIRNHLKGVKVGSEVKLFEVQTKESDIKGAQKLSHTQQYKFLDKAAVVTDPETNINNRWKLCTVTQVEELKSLIRMFPIWVIAVVVSISFSQFTTFFVSQAKIMDQKLIFNFTIPAASTPVFTAINAMILVPTYENVIVPVLFKYTGHPHGITSLQRIGVGIFISILALASAALVEKQRRDSPISSKMSVLWLVPQYMLLGTAELFACVGQMELFYNEATNGTKSISSAMFYSQLGVASMLTNVLISLITNITGGEDKGWLRNDLNESKLDYYYWILTATNGVSFLVYMWVARQYKGKNYCANVSVRPIVEMSQAQVVKKDEF